MNGLSDCLSLVFQHLSAYELAFLYLTGDPFMRHHLKTRVTRFELTFNPYRRVSWPSHFLGLFPKLLYVSIGNPSDVHGPFVPNMDLRVLPRGIRHLGLHVGNAMISFLSCSTPLSYESLNQRFPELESLHWNNTLSWTRSIDSIGIDETFITTLPVNLRALTMSLLPPMRNWIQNLPPHLEELRILACTGSQKHHWTLPSKLRRLELSYLDTGLRTTWPLELEHLRLEYRVQYRSMNELLPLPLPENLKSFHLLGLGLVIPSAFLAKLPQSLRSIKLYCQRIQDDSMPTDASLPPSLEVLHFCSIGESLYSQDVLFGLLPATMREFVVTTAYSASRMKSPKNTDLSVLRSNPLPVPGWYSFQPDSSLTTASLGRESRFPDCMVDMQTSINFFDFLPPTLTRLSLQSYVSSPTNRGHVIPSGLLPNVTDLTLHTEMAFDVLSVYAGALPLKSLSIGYYYHAFVSDSAYEKSCITKATRFDLRCFRSLSKLDVDLRWIDPKQRTAWLDRLPISLTDLSLVPYESRAEETSPGHVYTEAWMTFPRLPRSLTRFAGCLTDLHCHGVFGYLPPSLTELYMFGASVIGALATGSPNRPHLNTSAQVYIEPHELAFLPTSIKHLMLPQRSMDKFKGTQQAFEMELERFFASRPQLALFGFFYASMFVDTRHPAPHALVIPPNSNELYRQVPQHVPIFQHLRTHLDDQMSRCEDNNSIDEEKNGDGINSSTKKDAKVDFKADRAVRRPLDDFAAKELRYRWKASKIAQDKSLANGYSYLLAKLDKYGEEKQKVTKTGTCQPS